MNIKLLQTVQTSSPWLCCAALCCAVLCCAVLCCAVLCCASCAVLRCPVLCRAMLRCAVPCRAALCCAVLCHAVLRFAVPCRAALRCAMLCCAVLCCALSLTTCCPSAHCVYQPGVQQLPCAHNNTYTPLSCVPSPYSNVDGILLPGNMPGGRGVKGWCPGLCCCTVLLHGCQACCIGTLCRGSANRLLWTEQKCPACT